MARVQTRLDFAVQVVAELCTPHLKGSLRTQCKPNVHTNSQTQLGSREGSENWSQHALPASKLKNRLFRHANTEILCVSLLLPPKIYEWSTLLILYSLFLCNPVQLGFLPLLPLLGPPPGITYLKAICNHLVTNLVPFFQVLSPWSFSLPGTPTFLALVLFYLLLSIPELCAFPKAQASVHHGRTYLNRWLLFYISRLTL